MGDETIEVTGTSVKDAQRLIETFLEASENPGPSSPGAGRRSTSSDAEPRSGSDSERTSP
jgi:hypothetical protein